MNTKKISELIALEQVTEQTYLLVEQDGKACRLPISVLSEYLGTTGGNDSPEEDGLITFYLDDKAYKATEGMTFGDWVESEYNTDGYYHIDVCDDQYLTTEELEENSKGYYIFAGEDIIDGRKEGVTTIAWEINFTIFGCSAIAREGMTWEEWVDSPEYSSLGSGSVDILEDGVQWEGVYFYDNEGNRQYGSDIIVNGVDYGDEEQAPMGDFTFTIDNSRYGATDGMTWGDWVESEYNTSEGLIVISNGSPYYEGFYMSNQNGEQQYEADEIVAGGAYKCDIPE